MYMNLENQTELNSRQDGCSKNVDNVYDTIGDLPTTTENLSSTPPSSVPKLQSSSPPNEAPEAASFSVDTDSTYLHHDNSIDGEPAKCMSMSGSSPSPPSTSLPSATAASAIYSLPISPATASFSVDPVSGYLRPDNPIDGEPAKCVSMSGSSPSPLSTTLPSATAPAAIYSLVTDGVDTETNDRLNHSPEELTANAAAAAASSSVDTDSTHLQHDNSIDDEPAKYMNISGSSLSSTTLPSATAAAAAAAANYSLTTNSVDSPEELTAIDDVPHTYQNVSASASQPALLSPSQPDDAASFTIDANNA